MTMITILASFYIFITSFKIDIMISIVVVVVFIYIYYLAARKKKVFFFLWELRPPGNT